MGNIFPDDYYEFEIGWYRGADFNKEADELKKVLNTATRENDVQSYIKYNKKWFIPASIFENYDFGHHEAYLISEIALGSEYRADYMLVGRNSIGYHIVLVEFEDVNVDYRLKNANSETKAVRKGLTQIRDWKRWMDNHREYFLRSVGLGRIASNIPSWGIRYCLVVGRREKMDDIANQMRRQTEHEMLDVNIISYDRLVDNVCKLHNGF